MNRLEQQLIEHRHSTLKFLEGAERQLREYLASYRAIHLAETKGQFNQDGMDVLICEHIGKVRVLISAVTEYE